MIAFHFYSSSEAFSSLCYCFYHGKKDHFISLTHCRENHTFCLSIHWKRESHCCFLTENAFFISFLSLSPCLQAECFSLLFIRGQLEETCVFKDGFRVTTGTQNALVLECLQDLIWSRADVVSCMHRDQRPLSGLRVREWKEKVFLHDTNKEMAKELSLFVLAGSALASTS